MCFGPENNAPVEVGSTELHDLKQEGLRVLQMQLTVWNSTPHKDIEMVSGRWEGCREYDLSWKQLLELHTAISKKIEFLKPLIESGKIAAK